MTQADEGAKLLEKTWIVAHRLGIKGEELPLNFATKAARVQARFAMYNLAKAVKKNPQRYSHELTLAVESCMIAQVGETGLILRSKALQPLFQTIAGQLPEMEVAELSAPTAQALVSQETLDAEASYKRMMERHGNKDANGEIKKVENPYFKREKGE